MIKTAANKGSTILEAIIAIAIFSVVFTSLTVLYLGSYGSNLRDSERFQADMYMQQAFEAARSIRDYNFSNLTNGTHGLSRASGYWQFSGSKDILGQFIRSVEIDEIRRDTNCSIVESGGTIDTNSKKITVTITWDLEEGNETTISSSQYLNKWTDSTGCSLADNLEIDTSGWFLSNKNKRLKGVTIKNVGSRDIVIETIDISFTGAPGGTKLKKIYIDGALVWKGKKSLPYTADINDTTLSSDDGAVSTEFRFSKNIKGSKITVTFNLNDGSRASFNLKLND